MAREFRKGVEEIKRDAERKPGKRKWTPSIYWKTGDIKTIAFLTSADEAPKVRLHQMVKVPDDTRTSGVRYETVICKKDPAMVEDFNGECPLCDKVGHGAAERYVALAIELEPTREGKRTKSLAVKTNAAEDKDGNTVDYPQWGLVIQASSNFFSYFAAYHESTGDIRDVAWEIHREGSSSKTKYHPFIVMNGTNAVPLPDLSEIVDSIPSLDDLLEEMASPEKYAELEALPAGSQPSFGNDSKAPTDDGLMPSGNRETEFAKIRAEVEAY